MGIFTLKPNTFLHMEVTKILKIFGLQVVSHFANLLALNCAKMRSEI